MRKGFKFIPQKDVVTHVYDSVSAFVPDQSISLRDLLMRFAYIGTEKLEEIVNRGFDGDEDEDLIGVDVGALDFAEVHDRIIELRESQNPLRSVHVEPDSNESPPAQVVSVEDAADE